MKAFLLIGLWFLFSLSAAAQYPAEIAAWRAEHEKEIAAPNSWLTLAGLFWLKEGVNTIGRGAGFDVELTENFNGGKFGEIVLEKGKTTLRIEPAAEAFVKDERVTSIELESDIDLKPTMVRTGSQTFSIIKREERYAVRLRDTNYKSFKEFTGLKWYPTKEKFKVVATFEAFAEVKEVLIPNVLGGNFRMKSPGLLKFRLNGKQVILEPVLEAGTDRLFIIFRDATSRMETYGAGRFLYAAKPENGKVVLDFNKAENPPCAFTEFATCPLPPPQNRLKISIKAGEKRYH